MNEEEIIESGLLELYVIGSISQEDKKIVEDAIGDFPSVVSEIEQIENALIKLSEVAIPQVPESVWHKISNSIQGVRPLGSSSRKSNWTAITGWAAAVLCFAGLFWMMKENSELKERVRKTTTEKVVLQDQVETTENSLAETTELLEMVRSKDFQAINLPGNVAVAPQAYATVYFNAEENIAYIDAKGLPSPPEGKVYQVWSLKMDPLTPSSIGLLDAFDANESKFFRVENIPSPEAFGITLEPEGGSESPTLEQLYTLGLVQP